MKRWQKFFWKWGFHGIGMYLSYKFSWRKNHTMNVPECEADVTIRPGTSDMQVFESIFIEEQYSTDLLSDDFKPGVIIDAGANIGLSTIYLTNQFPKATIIAIEPEKSNFDLLQQNVRQFPNVVCLNKALWADDSLLELENPNDRKFSFQVKEVTGQQPSAIQGINVASLLSQYDCSDIGIMKIDIEGAEKELFSADTSWLAKTEVIFIELHERKKTGCVEAFYKAVNPYLKQEAIQGDTLLVITKRHAHELAAENCLKNQTGKSGKDSKASLPAIEICAFLTFLAALIVKAFAYEHDAATAHWHIVWEIFCVAVASAGILCRSYASAVFADFHQISEVARLKNAMSQKTAVYSPCHDLYMLGNFLIGLGIAMMAEMWLIKFLYVVGFIASTLWLQHKSLSGMQQQHRRQRRIPALKRLGWILALKANSHLITVVLIAFLVLEHADDFANFGRLNSHPLWTAFLVTGIFLQVLLQLIRLETKPDTGEKI